MKKPPLSRAEIDALNQWAARDQAELGLASSPTARVSREHVLFLSEAARWNHVRGMLKANLRYSGFGIECARVIGEIKNSRFELARNWKLAAMPLLPAAA